MSAQPINPEPSENKLIVEEARRLYEAGVLTFPASRTAKHPDRGIRFLGPDGKNIPRWSAEYYPPHGWPTMGQHDGMFQQPDVERMSLVCGSRSGGIVAFDFDQAGYFDDWYCLIPDALLAKIYVEQSQQSGRYHAAVRISENMQSCIPARDPRKPDGSVGDIRIEVRGEGNGFMAAPSVGYQRLCGDLADLPMLTPDEYQILLDAAATFNECAPRPQPERKARTLCHADGDELPGTRYNRENGQRDVLDLFQRHGWSIGRRDGQGNVSITRPGATSETSGNVNAKGVMHVFSTNTPFEPSSAGRGNPYAPFGVYATLEHGGDFSAAGKVLYAQYNPSPIRLAKAHNLDVDPETGEILPPPASPTRGSEEVSDEPPPKRPFTDLGNAERLIDRHGMNLRFVIEPGKWAAWDEIRWVLDDSGKADRCAMETVRAIYREAADAPDTIPTAELGKHAVKSEAAPRLAAMLELGRKQAGIPVHLQDFDCDPWLLNSVLGVIDLRTGILRSHERSEMHMKCVPIPYYPGVGAPTWEQFLVQVLPNAETRRFVQQAVGYSLTASTREQKFFLLYGTGSNGKSTFLEILAALLGDYAQSATMDTFAVRKNEGAIPNDIARMVGARLITTVETNEGMRLNESLVKQLTGGDRITARFLHREFFDFIPRHKLWIGVNHKPLIKGTDHAIWRRPALIPFTVTISEANQDKNLPEKLRAELPGILAWAVRGCLDWQKHGLVIPGAVRDATSEYRAEMDTLARFIDDRCILTKNASVTSSELYRAYREWSEQSGERYETETMFGKRLTERGLTREKRSGQRCWFGITLATSAVQGDLDTLDTLDTDSEVFPHE